MKKEIICISCPNGCHLVVEEIPGGVKVTGNKCMKGEIYGKAEVADPRRTVTAVVKTTSLEQPYVSVRTDKALPKKMIKPLLKELYKMEVSVPIKRGDVIVANYENTGINVVCTKSIKR